MGLALVAAAIVFHWIPVNHDLSLKEGVNVGAPAKVILVCMILYVGFYSSGMGNTAWLSSEFFPLEIRAYGISSPCSTIHRSELTILFRYDDAYNVLLGIQRHCRLHIFDSNGEYHSERGVRFRKFS